jgi:hypothetical protein
MSDSTTPTKRKAGRPHGSRNKSTLMKAQVLIDDLTLEAVAYLEALMKNDLTKLDSKDDVPYSIRFNATKEILAKGIANESKKDEVKQPVETTTTTEDGKKVHTGPQVFATAI